MHRSPNAAGLALRAASLDTVTTERYYGPRPRVGGRFWWTLGVIVIGVSLVGCRRSAAPPPADPMLEAIRAEERAAGLSYAEGQGRQLFRQYCTTCHGDEGKGDGQNASNLSPAPPDFVTSKRLQDADYVRRVIAQGSAAVGRSPLSPPWGRSLRPQEIEYLAAYCRALASKKP
jgi:mono/diheme cytochrome c family protein